MIVRKSWFDGARQVKFFLQVGYSRAGINGANLLEWTKVVRSKGLRRSVKRKGRIDYIYGCVGNAWQKKNDSEGVKSTSRF